MPYWKHSDGSLVSWWDQKLEGARFTGKGELLHAMKLYGCLGGVANRAGSTASVIARRRLFKARVRLENAYRDQLVKEHGINGRALVDHLLGGEVFGRSSKQGVSFRMPLVSCSPTAICMNSCYAHDGRDAAPNSIIRGMKNGLLSELFEYSPNQEQAGRILIGLIPHVRRAVDEAVREAARCKKDLRFSRAPRIRFSHVGDIAARKMFANTLAATVKQENPDVICVAYTRHFGENVLDPSLFRILYSIDSATNLGTIPPKMKGIYTYASFDGSSHKYLSTGNYRIPIDVNFCEHHGAHRNPPPAGNGFICPSTQRGNPHGCDANHCDRCFR